MASYDELIRALAAEVGLPPAAMHSAVQQALDEHDVGDRRRDHLIRLRLLELEASLRVEHTFEPGDLVRFKDGLRNRRRPDDDEVAVVVEHLPEPVVDGEEGSGSPYFREPLDLIVGLIDDDGDFVTFHLDSRRMEPIEPS